MFVCASRQRIHFHNFTSLSLESSEIRQESGSSCSHGIRRSCRCHVQRAAAHLVGGEATAEHVRLRLRHARLHDHHPHGIQYVTASSSNLISSPVRTTYGAVVMACLSSCTSLLLPACRSRADERRAALHPGGPGPHRRADRGARRLHECLHARLHPRRRLDGRHVGPTRHARARQRLPHGRRARHVARRQLRGPHGRALRHQYRHRVLPRRRARLQRRDLAGVRARRALVVARYFCQRRHPPQLRVQLRLGRTAGAPRLARHVRHRRAPAGVSRRGSARHAGVPAVARHARAPRRRARGARAHLRLPSGGRPPPRGDQARRRGAAGGCPRVAGADRPADGDGPADPRLRGRAAVPATGGRHRRHPAVQPADVQEGRHVVEQRHPGRHGGHRRRQDELHTRGRVLLRPRRSAPAPAGQHRRRGRVAHRSGPHALRPRDILGERGGVRGDHASLRRRVLRGARVAAVDVRRRDHPAAAARAGLEPRHGGQPADVRGGEHDLHIARRRDHHARVLLPVRRRGNDRLRVRVRPGAGDEGAELGGHGCALRQVMVWSIGFTALAMGSVRHVVV